jgi:hypothetical protein
MIPLGIYALYDWCFGDDAPWLYDRDDDHSIYSFDHGLYFPPNSGCWNPALLRESVEVKAWEYALERLRSGERAQVVDVDGRVSEISEDVDLQVVVVPPETAEQRDAFEEAQQVFSNLRAAVHPLEDVQAVADRAVDLVRRLKA